MSHVMSIRFRDDQVARLGRIARRLGKRPSETVSVLVEEALRMADYAYIEFRDSIAGRQAYVKSTGLAVWEVAMVARDYGWDEEKVAAHLHWPLARVQGAFIYARDFQAETDAALADNDAYDFATVRRLLPRSEQFYVDDPAPVEAP